MIPAIEVMLANNAIRNLIRENKTHQIDNVISTSGSLGMFTLEKGLSALVNTGDLDFETAIKYSNNQTELKRLVKEKK